VPEPPPPSIPEPEQLVAAEPEPVPPLSLSVEIDFAAREASISLAGDADDVRFVYEDGRWRRQPGSP
jgi:hypothetical protein